MTRRRVNGACLQRARCRIGCSAGVGFSAIGCMSDSAESLRDAIDRHIAAGEAGAARAALARLWRGESTPGSAAFVAARFEKLRGLTPLTPCRLAILRSFTVEPLVPILRAMAFVGGIDLTVQLGDFNTWSQDILDPASPLYAFGPDAVVLAAQTSEVVPALAEGFADLDHDA